jgi:hypothetical protein
MYQRHIYIVIKHQELHAMCNQGGVPSYMGFAEKASPILFLVNGKDVCGWFNLFNNYENELENATLER